MSVKLSIVIALLGLILVAGESKFNFKGLMGDVPEKERLNFLRHYLNVGYNLNNKPAYAPSPKLSNEGSIALYRYVTENFQISDEKDLEEARTIICFENGMCVDVGDLGVHPKL